MGRPGALVNDPIVDKLLHAEKGIAARVGRLWDEFDVLLMPMMSRPAPPAQVMEGRGAFATWQWQSSWVPFGVLFNATGQPAASVPAGFSKHGLPLAVQLVGAHRAEATLLSLAAQIEAARPWVPHRPRAFDC
jgi:amidase